MKPGQDVLDGRIGCQIAGCGRTVPNPKGHAQWVCPAHWRAAPANDRDKLKLLRRIIRRRPSPAAIAVFNAVYQRCIEAVETGVTAGPEGQSVEAFLAGL